ncbi:MAG: RNA methyltransferase [Oscillospiraceae bacterium]|nr:RNA methyltransferase [Oscillospiraceae bacterium]
MNEKILSRKNDKAVHLKKLGSDSGYRREKGAFFCDGEKLLEEAVKNGAEIEMVFACDELSVTVPDNVPVYETSYDVIESISPMKTPQKVVFSCRKRPPSGIKGGGRYIVLENLQDPGNVGTVLRTAGAMGIDGVILVGACADPYNHKAVRASMGAVFRVPFCSADLDSLGMILRDNGLKLYGAALADDCIDIRDVDFNDCAVAIGSEGQGLSRELLDMCLRKIIIPMDERCESLNAAAAAAMIMWEMARQKQK